MEAPRPQREIGRVLIAEPAIVVPLVIGHVNYLPPRSLKDAHAIDLDGATFSVGRSVENEIKPLFSACLNRLYSLTSPLLLSAPIKL
jgi:hypothetical protein